MNVIQVLPLGWSVTSSPQFTTFFTAGSLKNVKMHTKKCNEYFEVQFGSHVRIILKYLAVKVTKKI